MGKRMHQLYKQLLDDHRNLATLLRFVRDQVARYDDDDRETHVDLILEALEYISDYADAVHHPLEEAAFDQMAEKSLGDPEVIELIRHQHEELASEKAKVTGLFEMIFNDHAVPVDKLKATLDHYLDLQFAHMEAEESKILPVMSEQLTAEDWDKIAARIASQPDPLFHHKGAESYAALRRELELD